MVTASGCAPPMPPRPAVSTSRPARSAPKCFSPAAGEGLVGALQDALRADVDPRAGRHLAVHGETQRVQAAELVPVVPVAHEVGVGDEHARRPLVGLEHADRLARLHQQRLVVLEALEGGDDGVEGLPVARRLARPTVDDQVLGTLGDLRVEVVHQHAHRAPLAASSCSSTVCLAAHARRGQIRRRSWRPPIVRKRLVTRGARGRRAPSFNPVRKDIPATGNGARRPLPRAGRPAGARDPRGAFARLEREAAHRSAFARLVREAARRSVFARLVREKREVLATAGRRHDFDAVRRGHRPDRQHDPAVDLVPDLGDGSVHGRQAHEDALPAGDLAERGVARPG